MKNVALLSVLWLATVLGGCGDPLVGESFRGKPMWSVDATVLAGAPDLDTATDLRIALFYSPGGPSVLDPEQWVEQISSSRPIVVPSDDTVNVFEAPGPELFAHDDAGTALDYAVARLVVYADANGNGRRDPGEQLLAIQGPVAYVYAAKPLPAGVLTTGALPAGYRFVTLPESCGDPAPGPTTPGDCGVPLGARCNSDADCNGGTCLQQTKLPWPAGYCAVLDPPPNGCRPGDGRFLHRAMYSPNPPGAQGYWLKRCVQDSDCVRPQDPAEGLLRCEPALEACVYAGTGLMNAGSSVPVEPFCARDVHR